MKNVYPRILRLVGAFAALATSTIAVSAAANSAEALEAVTPEGFEWAADYGMSPAIRAGDMLYLTGQVARVEGGGDDALRAAYQAMFESAGAILAEAGADWSSVVDITSFHTDIEAQGDLFMEVRGNFISGPTFPTWTAIDVDQLYTDDIATEIKIVAYVGE